MVKDRNESLQVNSRWKALDEIYKIDKLLHRSAFKNSAKFRQTFSHFYNFMFENSLIFRNFCPYLTKFEEKFPEYFRKFAGKDQNLLLVDSEISNRKLLKFSKNGCRKVRKNPF